MSNSEKEDAGFKVVDRRKRARKKAAKAEPSEPKGSGAPAEPEQEPVQAEGQAPPEEAPEPKSRAEEQVEQLPALDVYGVLRWCIGLLSAQAWQWLALVANPATGEVKKDLEQARLSIDSVAALVDRLSPKVDPEERREWENLVSNLRLNFVNQSQPGGAPSEKE